MKDTSVEGQRERLHKMLCENIRKELEQDFTLYGDTRYGGLSKAQVDKIYSGVPWAWRLMTSRNQIKKLSVRVFAALKRRSESSIGGR
ncbi:MAG: hypothetical protein WAN14_10960 [Candidatus Acidiferrales bacterium]